MDQKDGGEGWTKRLNKELKKEVEKKSLGDENRRGIQKRQTRGTDDKR